MNKKAKNKYDGYSKCIKRSSKKNNITFEFLFFSKLQQPYIFW